MGDEEVKPSKQRILCESSNVSSPSPLASTKNMEEKPKSRRRVGASDSLRGEREKKGNNTSDDPDTQAGDADDSNERTALVQDSEDRVVPYVNSNRSAVQIRRNNGQLIQLTPFQRRVATSAFRATISMIDGVLIGDSIASPIISAAFLAYEVFGAVRDYHTGAPNQLGFRTTKTDVAMRVGLIGGTAALGIGVGQGIAALIGLSAIPVAGQVILGGVLSVIIGFCVGTLITRYVDRRFVRAQLENQYGYKKDEFLARQRFEKILEDFHDLSSLEACRVVQHYADYRVSCGWESVNEIDDYRATQDLTRMPRSLQHFAIVQLQRKWKFTNNRAESRRLVRMLMLQYHPDRGGDGAVAAQLNNDFEVYCFCQDWDEGRENTRTAQPDPQQRRRQKQSRNPVVDFIRSLFRAPSNSAVNAEDLHQVGLLALEAGTQSELQRLDEMDWDHFSDDDDDDNEWEYIPDGGSSNGSIVASQQAVSRALDVVHRRFQLVVETVTFAGLLMVRKDAAKWTELRNSVELFTRMQAFIRCDGTVQELENTKEKPNKVSHAVTHTCLHVSWQTRADAIRIREAERNRIVELCFGSAIVSALTDARELWTTAKHLVDKFVQQLMKPPTTFVRTPTQPTHSPVSGATEKKGGNMDVSQKPSADGTCDSNAYESGNRFDGVPPSPLSCGEGTREILDTLLLIEKDFAMSLTTWEGTVENLLANAKLQRSWTNANAKGSAAAGTSTTTDTTTTASANRCDSASTALDNMEHVLNTLTHASNSVEESAAISGMAAFVDELHGVGLTASSALAGSHAKRSDTRIIETLTRFFHRIDSKREAIDTLTSELLGLQVELKGLQASSPTQMGFSSSIFRGSGIDTTEGGGGGGGGGLRDILVRNIVTPVASELHTYVASAAGVKLPRRQTVSESDAPKPADTKEQKIARLTSAQNDTAVQLLLLVKSFAEIDSLLQELHDVYEYHLPELSGTLKWVSSPLFELVANTVAQCTLSTPPEARLVTVSARWIPHELERSILTYTKIKREVQATLDTADPSQMINDSSDHDEDNIETFSPTRAKRFCSAVVSPSPPTSLLVSARARLANRCCDATRPQRMAQRSGASDPRPETEAKRDDGDPIRTDEQSAASAASITSFYTEVSHAFGAPSEKLVSCKVQELLFHAMYSDPLTGALSPCWLKRYALQDILASVRGEEVAAARDRRSEERPHPPPPVAGTTAAETATTMESEVPSAASDSAAGYPAYYWSNVSGLLRRVGESISDAAETVKNYPSTAAVTAAAEAATSGMPPPVAERSSQIVAGFEEHEQQQRQQQPRTAPAIASQNTGGTTSTGTTTIATAPLQRPLVYQEAADMLTDLLQSELRFATSCSSRRITAATHFFTDAAMEYLYFHIPRGTTQLRFCTPVDVQRRIARSGVHWLHDALTALIDLHECNVVHGDVRLSNYTYDEFGNTTLGNFSVGSGSGNSHGVNYTCAIHERTLHIANPSRTEDALAQGKAADAFQFGVMLHTEVIMYLREESSRDRAESAMTSTGSPMTRVETATLSYSEMRQDAIEVFTETADRLIGKLQPQWGLLDARRFLRRYLNFRFDSDEQGFTFSKEVTFPPFWMDHVSKMPIQQSPLDSLHLNTSLPHQLFLNRNSHLWEGYWRCRRHMMLYGQGNVTGGGGGTLALPAFLKNIPTILSCDDDCEVNERYMWMNCPRGEEQAWAICQRGICAEDVAIPSSGGPLLLFSLPPEVPGVEGRGNKDAQHMGSSLEAAPPSGARATTQWAVLCRILLGTVAVENDNPGGGGGGSGSNEPVQTITGSTPFPSQPSDTVATEREWNARKNARRVITADLSAGVSARERLYVFDIGSRKHENPSTSPPSMSSFSQSESFQSSQWAVSVPTCPTRCYPEFVVQYRLLE